MQVKKTTVLDKATALRENMKKLKGTCSEKKQTSKFLSELKSIRASEQTLSPVTLTSKEMSNTKLNNLLRVKWLKRLENI